MQMSPAISDTVTVNQSKSSGRSTVSDTKLKFTTCGKMIQYNVCMRL